MKISKATLYCLSLPFVERFSHSLGARHASESIFVRMETDRGVVGHGEGMPRTYVTGEDFDSCLAAAKDTLWPRLVDLSLPEGDDFKLSDLLDLLQRVMPLDSGRGTVAHNAVRCAFELAVIDSWLRTCGRSLGAELAPRLTEVAYSAVIPTGTVAGTESHARQWKLLGFDQVKVKIDGTLDRERLTIVRDIFGPAASVRVDGNAAYTVESGLACLESLAPLGIASAEQMLAKGALGDLARMRRSSPVPLMVDESLVTLQDAQDLIEAGACDLFNVRVSKCGGLGPSLLIVERARSANLGFQLGCHVGETAVLSAVGRHLAAHLGDALFVEGSFGNLLLKEDVSRDNVRFGHRGRAKLLSGVGFGVEVVGDVLMRHAPRTLELSGESARVV